MAEQANLISDIRLQFQDFFGSLSLGKRITILAAIGVIIIGSSWTSVISLTGTVTSDVFGLRRLGTIYGTMFVVMPFGASSAVWLAGQLYDTMGNYDLALWISLAMGLIATLAVGIPNTGISKRIWKKSP